MLSKRAYKLKYTVTSTHKSEGENGVWKVFRNCSLDGQEKGINELSGWVNNPLSNSHGNHKRK